MEKLKLGMLKVILLASKYKKMNACERKNIQEQRLLDIVAYAKENSPYFSELYKDLAMNFKLTDIPPTNKLTLMAHFDQWITDDSVTLTALTNFMQNPDNIGRKFNDNYLVFTTSGSTGNPAVTLCDKTCNNVMGGVNILRSYARKKDLKEFIKRGGKSIGVFATGGFYLSNSSIRARLLMMPWKKKQMAVTSALLPIPQIVKELNEFQPVMLGGYPTILELLIDEAINDRLHIAPTVIMTGGEYLSMELREKLTDTFGCYVQTSYSCTEGGSIACECTEQHFHINDDWVIVEAVDKNNNPVPDGTQSDKILLTNLSNYSQPFIRYEITDRIVMHHEPCSCGNSSPWLTLEGRTDDILSFFEDETEIRIAPLALYATMKEIPEISRFQILSHTENKNTLELRLIPVDNCDKNAAYQLAYKKLHEFLALYGISNVTFYLSDNEPMQHPQSGKFKHIMII